MKHLELRQGQVQTQVRLQLKAAEGARTNGGKIGIPVSRAEQHSPMEHCASAGNCLKLSNSSAQSVMGLRTGRLGRNPQGSTTLPWHQCQNIDSNGYAP